MQETLNVMKWLFAAAIAATGLLAGTAPAQTPSHFPTAVGSEWVYRVQFEGKEETDTLTVRVADTVTLPAVGRPAHAWVFTPVSVEWGVLWDTLWLVNLTPGPVADVWLAFFDSRAADVPTFRFRLPFEVGSEWECRFCRYYDFQDYQRYRVDEVTAVETPAGTFEEVFVVSQSFHCGDECGGEIKYWIKPGVGIVRRSQLSRSGGSPAGASSIRVVWELIDYHIPGE